MIKRLLTLFLSLVLGVSLSGALAGTALAVAVAAGAIVYLNRLNRKGGNDDFR